MTIAQPQLPTIECACSSIQKSGFASKVKMP